MNETIVNELSFDIMMKFGVRMAMRCRPLRQDFPRAHGEWAFNSFKDDAARMRLAVGPDPGPLAQAGIGSCRYSCLASLVHELLLNCWLFLGGSEFAQIDQN